MTILTPESAASLAAAMFRDVWNAVASCPRVQPILATVDETAPADNVWLQGEGDLGARIERVMRRALAIAPAAIVVGADTPTLTSEIVAEALIALTMRDAVIGRCEDGGFYLFGLRQCPPGLLSDLPWSTRETASALLRRLNNNAFSVQEIANLFDVDLPDDLVRLKQLFDADSSIAPATRAWYAVQHHRSNTQ